jgi:hypothetical protein
MAAAVAKANPGPVAGKPQRSRTSVLNRLNVLGQTQSEKVGACSLLH